ncbi:MAG: hypothetical protein Kow0026_04190 [Oricola sp.]
MWRGKAIFREMAMLRTYFLPGLDHSDAEDLMTSLRALGHWIDTAIEFVDNRYGIGIVDRSCIEFLVARPQGSGYRDIAEELNLTAGEATALVSRLERRGFARRERDAADPDAVMVHAVTDDPAVRAIIHARQELLDGLLKEFGPEELAVIARCARHLASIHPARLVEGAERKAVGGDGG